MAELAYREVYAMNRVEARKRLLRTVQETGSIRQTARLWHTSRQVVRKWLPRYQWTACDGRTRLRFLAFSHTLSTTHGLAFLLLVLSWLRAWGVHTPVAFQSDWGVEFGGDNPQRVQELSTRFLAPLGGALCRYPLGRKGYNGRVERSHRTDDEEFYRPYLLQARDTEEFLRWGARWVYVYNVLRPHSGVGMHQQPPLTVLKRLGYTGRDEIALFPPILLDPISTDVLLSRDPQGGNNLLAHYIPTDEGVEKHLCRAAR